MLSHPPQRGFTLVELMIGIALLAIILAIGGPSFATWLQNTQIRNMSEAVKDGLQLARAEAVRRNARVRFQLVDGLTNGCALSTSGSELGRQHGQRGGCLCIDQHGRRRGAGGAADRAMTLCQRWLAQRRLSSAGRSSIEFNGLGRDRHGAWRRHCNQRDQSDRRRVCGSAPDRCVAFESS